MNMIGSFFRLPKPKQFKYKPRFYNAQKDELEQRIKAREFTEDQTEEERLRIKMQNDWDRQRIRRQSEHKGWTRLLILVALIVLLLYIIIR